MASYVSDVVHI